MALSFAGLRANNLEFHDLLALMQGEPLDHLSPKPPPANKPTKAQSVANTPLLVKNIQNKIQEAQVVKQPDSTQVDLPPSPPGAPLDTRVAIVQCSSTKGPLKLAIHESWAPLGAKRFLDLVESKFFSTEVWKMQICAFFLC